MAEEGNNSNRLEAMMLALMESNKKILDQQAQLEAKILRLEKGNHQSGEEGDGPKTDTNQEKGVNYIFDDEEELVLRKIQTDKTTSKEVSDLTKRFENMQTMLKKSHGVEDYLFDINYLCSHPDVALPAKLKLNDVNKFDGTGDPKAHLRQFVSSMKPKGLTKEQLAVAFPMTLTGAASTWYHSQDVKKFKVWEEMAQEFVKQYAYNLQLDVTIRDLETTRQKSGETFSEFLQRWKGKAVKMTSRPSEKDQVRMIVKNLQPTYYERLLAIPIATFEQLCDAGTQVEDAIFYGKIGKDDASSNDGGSKSAEASQVNTIIREFTPLGMTLSAALQNLTKQGLLKPLEPRPLPNPVPPKWNLNEYCSFHQRAGHVTDECGRLRHEIQNIIDAEEDTKPNTLSGNGDEGIGERDDMA